MNRYKTGNRIKAFVVFLSLTAVSPALGQFGDGYDLSWWTIDGGGGTIMGNGYTMTDVVGQPDAHVVSTGSYTLQGGFLPGFAPPMPTPTPVILTVEDSAGSPGATNVPVQISLDNIVNVKEVQLTLCDIVDLQDWLTLGSQAPEPDPTRAPGFIVGVGEAGGCAEVVMTSAGDFIAPGTGPILTLYYDVDAAAVAGTEIAMQLTAYNVADENNDPLPVIPANGTFTVGVKGDLTGDGHCDLFDVLRQIDIVLSKPPAPSAYELWAGDMDDDSNIDLFDVLALIDCILGRTACACANGGGDTAEAESNTDEDTLKTEELIPDSKANTLTIAVELSNKEAVKGLSFRLSHIPEGLTLRAIHLAEGLEGFHVDFSQAGQEARVILVSIRGDLIDAGDGLIMNLVFETSAKKLRSRSGFVVLKNIQAAGEENKPVKIKLKVPAKR